MKLLISFFVLALAASAQATVKNIELKNAKGEVVGHASISERRSGLLIDVDIKGLEAGEKAIHLHSAGLCEGPDFKSAGGHFNPEHKEHGKENPKGAHMGDLPNLKVGADGTAKMKIPVAGVTFRPSASTLATDTGSALVIHAAPDDYKTDPAGNAGARVACGVIFPPKAKK